MVAQLHALSAQQNNRFLSI